MHIFTDVTDVWWLLIYTSCHLRFEFVHAQRTACTCIRLSVFWLSMFYYFCHFSWWKQSFLSPLFGCCLFFFVVFCSRIMTPLFSFVCLQCLNQCLPSQSIHLEREAPQCREMFQGRSQKFRCIRTTCAECRLGESKSRTLYGSVVVHAPVWSMGANTKCLMDFCLHIILYNSL